MHTHHCCVMSKMPRNEGRQRSPGLMWVRLGNLTPPPPGLTRCLIVSPMGPWLPGKYQRHSNTTPPVSHVFIYKFKAKLGLWTCCDKFSNDKICCFVAALQNNTQVFLSRCPYEQSSMAYQACGDIVVRFKLTAIFAFVDGMGTVWLQWGNNGLCLSWCLLENRSPCVKLV